MPCAWKAQTLSSWKRALGRGKARAEMPLERLRISSSRRAKRTHPRNRDPAAAPSARRAGPSKPPARRHSGSPASPQGLGLGAWAIRAARTESALSPRSATRTDSAGGPLQTRT